MTSWEIMPKNSPVTSDAASSLQICMEDRNIYDIRYEDENLVILHAFGELRFPILLLQELLHRTEECHHILTRVEL